MTARSCNRRQSMYNTKEGKSCVIYIRVSSERQVKGDDKSKGKLETVARLTRV